MPCRTRWVAGVLCVLAGLSFFTHFARAHDQSFSHADLTIGRGEVSLSLTVHRNDAAPILSTLPESLMSAGFVRLHGAALASVLASRSRLEVDGHEARLTFLRAEPRPEKRSVTLYFRASCDPNAQKVGFRARPFPENTLHECFLNVYRSGQLVKEVLLTYDQPGVELQFSRPQSALAVLRTFVPAGIHHIFMGPDHILFLVGLLLMGGRVRRILKVVTAFTAAHSVTLALAGLGWVTPSPRLVEPLIALSVAYVGVESLRAREGRPDARPLLAFVFGLVHGFGLASVLREVGLPRQALGWSLLGFNMGVEIGQAAIVLAVAPVLSLARARAPRIAPRLVWASSWAVVACGSWWFLARVVGGR